MKIGEIITTVGKKRFFILAFLVVIGAVLGGLWQKWLIPQHQLLADEKMAVESDRIRLQQEIRDLPSKYEGLRAAEKKYDELVDRGFMADQDRILARRNMDALRAQSGLRGVTYDISPQSVIEHSQSYALNSNVVKSEIKVKFLSLSDIEIRNFIEEMQRHFGGLVVARTLTMKLKDPLTDEALLRLSSKEPVDFVEGEGSFDWYNIVPKPIDPTSPEAQAFGAGGQQ